MPGEAPPSRTRTPRAMTSRITHLAQPCVCGSVPAVLSKTPAFIGLAALSATALFAADDAAVFDSQIRPLLKDYCLKCHSTEEQKGDLDLEVFTSLAEV